MNSSWVEKKDGVLSGGVGWRGGSANPARMLGFKQLGMGKGVVG